MTNARTPLEALSPRDRRVVRHIRAIAEAGHDIGLFVAALRKMKEDLSLTRAQRDAILRTLAQDAAIAYVAIATGKPVELGRSRLEPGDR